MCETEKFSTWLITSKTFYLFVSHWEFHILQLVRVYNIHILYIILLSIFILIEGKKI